MKKQIILAFIVVLILGISIGFQISNKEKTIENVNTETKQIKTGIVAVDNNGKGVSADLITEVKSGNGLVLVNINNVLADYDMQLSARIAAKAAANYTNKNLDNLDIIYNIKTNADLVAGPSAGSTMAIATVMALENKTSNNNVLITGIITEDGKIEQVGAILEKAKAAKELGAKIFLIPYGSGTETMEYKKEKSCTKLNNGEYCVIRYKGESIDLSKDVGIEIKEVRNLKEALKYYES